MTTRPLSFSVVILGAGPAGLSAAIQARRAGHLSETTVTFPTRTRFHLLAIAGALMSSTPAALLGILVINQGPLAGIR